MTDAPRRRRAGEILGEIEARSATEAGATQAIASGSLGYGSGGPMRLDQFGSRRAPAPAELVEQYKAVAYACMSLNADGVASTPLRLYCTTGPRDRPPRRDVVPVPPERLRYLGKIRSLQSNLVGAKSVDEVADHPYLDALSAPNDFFDGASLLAYLCLCLDAVGSFYLWPDRLDPTWAASKWWPLQPQYVLPVKGVGAQILAGYTYFGQGFGPDELERGRLISLRDPYLSGYAPLHACYEQLGLFNYYTATVEGLLKSGARPSGMVGPKDATQPWSEATQRRLERQINSRSNRGQEGWVWVVDGSYTFTPLGYSPVDLGGLELSKNARLTAANCFRVPISLLQTEDSNRSVAEAGNYQHQRYGIRPRCLAIAAALTKMARAVDPRLFFAFDNPVEANEESRTKLFDVRIKNNSLLINEVRAEEGRPPVAWGDEPFTKAPAAPPGQAALPPPPEPAEGGETKGKGKGEAEDDGPAEPDDEAERKLIVEVGGLIRDLRGRLDAADHLDRARRRRRRAGDAGDPLGVEAGPGGEEG